MKAPNSVSNLARAIRRYCAGKNDDIRLARAMADVVLGQMLPDGVVKGGSSLMFRYGGDFTRYTRDVDTARTVELGAYLEMLRARLEAGWNGFTGKITEVEPPSPANIPKPYLMLPYDVKLQYCGRAWMTVRIEIGHNEIGDADEAEFKLPEDIAEAFEALGFLRPDAIPVMGVAHQIAQKLHAASAAGSDRAHDLVDLQLICEHSEVDLATVRSVCERLFRYRREQAWPPAIVKGENWDAIYAEARGTLRRSAGVRENADEAVAWANDFIKRIDGGLEG